MKSRISALVALSLLCASHAGASILSASSQAVREPSTETAGYWNANTLQQDLNASLREAAVSSAPVGPLASTRAPIVGGGLMVNGAADVNYTPFSGSDALDDLFQIDNESGAITRGAWDPNGPVIAGQGGRGGRDGRRDHDRDHDRDRKRDRDNPYATPEPSTWVLLGSGLLVLGAYVGLRRRDALSV